MRDCDDDDEAVVDTAANAAAAASHVIEFNYTRQVSGRLSECAIITRCGRACASWHTHRHAPVDATEVRTTRVRQM